MDAESPPAALAAARSPFHRDESGASAASDVGGGMLHASSPVQGPLPVVRNAPRDCIGPAEEPQRRGAQLRSLSPGAGCRAAL
jgi:hypothetical protein